MRQVGALELCVASTNQWLESRSQPQIKTHQKKVKKKQFQLLIMVGMIHQRESEFSLVRNKAQVFGIGQSRIRKRSRQELLGNGREHKEFCTKSFLVKRIQSSTARTKISRFYRDRFWCTKTNLVMERGTIYWTCRQCQHPKKHLEQQNFADEGSNYEAGTFGQLSMVQVMICKFSKIMQLQSTEIEN